MKTYYKVVSVHNKNLWSMIRHSWRPGQQPVRYIRNKWTYPPKRGNSYLYVFNDKLHIESLKDQYNRRIYKCEVKNPRPAPWPWNEEALFVDAVKITERVY